MEHRTNTELLLTQFSLEPVAALTSDGGLLLHTQYSVVGLCVCLSVCCHVCGPCENG